MKIESLDRCSLMDLNHVPLIEFSNFDMNGQLPRFQLRYKKRSGIIGTESRGKVSRFMQLFCVDNS